MCVVYQVSWPSRLAAAINSASAAEAGAGSAPAMSAETSASADRRSIRFSPRCTSCVRSLRSDDLSPPAIAPRASRCRGSADHSSSPRRRPAKRVDKSPHPPSSHRLTTTNVAKGGEQHVMQGQQVFPDWIRDTRAPVPLPPPKSCDCQFHIYGDPTKYPPQKNAYYQPPDATFEHMQGVLKTLGFERGVIVHPMPYDTDHRLLIDSLEGLGPDGRKNFRATCIVKDHVTDKELERLDALGVCAGALQHRPPLRAGLHARGSPPVDRPCARHGLARQASRRRRRYRDQCGLSRFDQGHPGVDRPHGAPALRGRPRSARLQVARQQAQERRLVDDAVERQSRFQARERLRRRHPVRPACSSRRRPIA